MSPSSRRFITIITRRLALMPAVARWKWEHGMPIEDPVREVELIAAFRQKAESRGIDPEFAEQVIVAQIDAAKLIQRECFRRWETSPPEHGSIVLDLANELRPRLDRLTDDLLDVLAERPVIGTEPMEGLSAPLRRALSPWLNNHRPANATIRAAKFGGLQSASSAR
jgi:chorismate mutase-like protein